ncbi:hypothetical protein IJ818_04655 [bacterium]|nr:hypothetical protein [bacterium]
MNIADQLNLLQNIKESLKSKLLKIGAKIDDDTPFSEYAEFIRNAEKTVFTDSFLGSFHRKDKTSIFCTDNYGNSTHKKDKSSFLFSDSFLDSVHKKDKSSIFASDSNLGSTHTKEISSLHLTDFAEYHRVYANPVMTSNSMNGWAASASRANSGNEAYKGFNKDMTGENCWWTGSNPSYPCWISLSFDTLYKIRSVEIINENASPENFKNALIQFRTSNEDEWETLYEIVNRPNITAHFEEYQIDSDTAYKEFRLYIIASHSSTVFIQNININFKE